MNVDTWVTEMKRSALPRFLKETTGMAMARLSYGGKVTETYENICKEAGIHHNSLPRHLTKLLLAGLLRKEHDAGYVCIFYLTRPSE